MNREKRADRLGAGAYGLFGVAKMSIGFLWAELR